MTRIKTLFAGVSLALALLLASGSAYALDDHTWVSSTGGGAACTRTAPCRYFTDAVAATAAGGVISMVDSGDFGSVTITKSLTIRAEGADGGATLTNAFGPFIAIDAAATDAVTLEGLNFSGAGGVLFESGGQLHVVRCVITNGNEAGPNVGIKFAPNSPSKLSVTDSVITNEGNGTGGGIVVKPRAGGSAQVALERVTVNGNAFGVVADGTGSTAGINMTIADSMIANNIQDGIIATTPASVSPAAAHCSVLEITVSRPTAATARSPDRWR
jgi:hypothetical protein